MNAAAPVTLTTPDGIERTLRCTAGALKLFHEEFGTQNFIAVSQEKGDWVLYRIAWLMMFDEEGQPPADLSFARFLNSAPGDAGPELLAAISSAVSQGRQSKNDLEVLFAKAKTTMEREEMNRLIGSTSMPLPTSASDSAAVNSGGASSSQNSRRSRTNGSATKSAAKKEPTSVPA